MRKSFFLFCLFIVGTMFGQNSSVDSLLDLMDKSKKEDPDKALGYALTALQLVMDKQMDRVGEMNYNVGLIYIQKGDYKNALDYFERNLKTGINTSNTKFIARASINMANIYMAQGKLILH